jgi:hypothetical protein
MHSSSCLLPRWDQLPFTYELSSSLVGSQYHAELAPNTNIWACFVNCSQAVTNNSWYNPVTCRSTNNSSFVYVSVSNDDGCRVYSLEPSCGYLATIPLGSYGNPPYPLLAETASYANILELVKKGFSVRFPIDEDYDAHPSLNSVARSCLTETNG